MATQQKTAERDGMLFSLNTNLSCSCCSLRSESQQRDEIYLKLLVTAMGFYSNLNIKKMSEMNVFNIFLAFVFMGAYGGFLLSATHVPYEYLCFSQVLHLKAVPFDLIMADMCCW